MDTSDDTTLKTCSKCGRSLPETTEFFYLNHGKLRGACKECHRAAVSERQKVSEAFTKYQHEYARRNAERKNAAARAWREANPERQKAACLSWRKANLDYEREMKRAYCASHREQVRLLGRQGANARKARKAGLVVTKADYSQILAEHGMVCHLCGGNIETMRDLHFDHVIPLAAGGAHAPHNIRPSHRVCNQRKGAKT